MHVHVLLCENFRNLEQVSVTPHPRFNVLSGDNGQGKTNLLEAIYLLSTLRSFRTSRTEELIRFDAPSSRVRARVEKQDVERQLAVELGRGKISRKVALVDGKPARAVEYFGGINAVLFAPDDLRLPKGPPVMRRRFLDRAVWNDCAAYLEEVQTYERVLRSRNALLRGNSTAPAPAEELLLVYDDQLAAAGTVIMDRRSTYLTTLSPQVESVFENLTKSGVKMSLRYRQSCDSSRILDQLQRDRRRDLQKGYTHSGPHADDVEFELDGRAASLYASQGQIRALVLAWKIAEIGHLYRTFGEAPVLLLDDVSSELDSTRNAHLFDFLRAIPCQTFITTTSPAHINVHEDRKDFRVCAGTLEELTA